MPEDKTKFELSDADVETLGLVFAGASREDFFFVKSSEEQPKQEEETQDIARKNFAQMIAGTVVDALKSILHVKPASEQTDDAPETNEEDTEEEEPVEEDKACDDEKEKLGKEDVIEDTSKQEAIMPEDTVITQVDMEKYNGLANRVKEMEAELAKAKEREELAVFVVKASSFEAIPVNPGELADHMYWLSKTDEKRYQWFDSVMRALDNQLIDAGLWLEKGVSYTSETSDPIIKAINSQDPRAALLAIGKEDASKYLRSVRKEA